MAGDWECYFLSIQTLLPGCLTWQDSCFSSQQVIEENNADAILAFMNYPRKSNTSVALYSFYYARITTYTRDKNHHGHLGGTETNHYKNQTVILIKLWSNLLINYCLISINQTVILYIQKYICPLYIYSKYIVQK